MAGEFGSAKLDDDLLQAPAPVQGELSKGWDRGMPGAGASLANMGALGAEALGFDGGARTLRGAAQGFQTQAQDPRIAARVGNWRDIASPRDLIDYGAGVIGESGPSMLPAVGAAGAVALSGGAALPVLAAGAAASAPFEIGDVAGRQYADPQAMEQSAPTRLRDAVLGGGASALAQGIVPGMVGGKLAGKAFSAGAKAAERGTLRHVASEIGKDALIEGASEGGGELVKQYAANQDKPLDMSAALDNAIAGGVAGGAMGLPGGAADAARGALQKGSAVVQARRAGENGSTGPKTASVDPSEPPSGGASDLDAPETGIFDALSGLKDKGADVVKRLREGLPMGDLTEFASAQGDRLKQLVTESDNAAVQKAREIGERLLARASLPDDAKAQVSDALANLQDSGKRAALAAMETAESGKVKAMDAAKRLKDRWATKAQAPEGDTKQSADYSGQRTAIAAALARAVEGKPEAAVNDLVEAVQGILRQAESGKVKEITSQDVDTLTDALGEDAPLVLDDAFRAAGSREPAARDAFYAMHAKLKTAAERRGSIMGVLTKNLLPEHASDVDTTQLRALSDKLMDYARGRVNEGRTPAERAAFNDRLRAGLTQYFGENTDTVLDAVQKETEAQDAARREELVDDTVRDAATEERLDTQYFGGGRGNEPLMRSDVFKATKSDGLDRAKQKEADLKLKYPDREVVFVSERERNAAEGKTGGRDDHGFFAVRKADDADQLSESDLKKATLDQGKKKVGQEHPARLDAVYPDGTKLVLDAVALTRVAASKLGAYTEYDQQSARHRAASAFKAAVAMLLTREGGAPKMKFANGTVIAYLGGEPFTVGDMKQLKSDTAEDRMSLAGKARLKNLREAYKDTLGDPQFDGLRDEIAQEASELMGREKNAELSAEPRSGEDSSIDDGVIKDAPDEEITVDMAGDSTNKSATPVSAERNKRAMAAIETLSARGTIAEKIANRARVLVHPENWGRLDEKARTALGNLAVAGTSPSDMQAVVNRIARQFKDVLRGPAELEKFDTDAAKRRAKTETGKPAKARDLTYVDSAVVDENYEGVDGATFKVDAQKRLAELNAMEREAERTGEDLPALQEKARMRLKDMLREDSTFDWGSFNEDFGPGQEGSPDPKASAATAATSTTKAATGASNSLQGVGATPQQTAQQRQEVRDYVLKVLGPKVKVLFKRISHAGDFSEGAQHDVLRVSSLATNPLSVAYHEALHGFFARLRRDRIHDVIGTLQRTADSPQVRSQLETLLAAEPAALKQIDNDAEERVAYMFQFWSAGALKIDTKPATLMGKIMGVIRDTFGLWSNDKRAVEIMQYFQSGDFDRDGSAAGRVLTEMGKPAAWRKMQSMTEPLAGVSDSVIAMGGGRLRDTKITAMQEIADLIKRPLTQTGDDPGFIAAARFERTSRLNELGRALEGTNKADVAEALEALQERRPAVGTKAKVVARTVRKVLDDTFDYMRAAGVLVNDLGYGKDYFPRVWDIDYISRNQQKFLDTLRTHGVSDPSAVLNTLMTSDGNEFQVEVRRPGMSFKKQRVLTMVPDAAAAEFMVKDMQEIMASYISQATRRAEWARRFGDDSKALNAMLDKAVRQGATPKQVATAERYFKAVNGTLGDDFSPTLRRLSGNVMVYQNIRLLPLAIFSSVVDPMGVLVRGGTVNEAWSTFTRGLKEVRKSYSEEARNQKDADTRLAEDIGVIDDVMLTATLGQLYSQGMVGGTARKINDTFFRWNMMEMFNQSMRVGATRAAINFIERHAQGVSPHSRRYLAELGLEPADVVMKNGKLALFEADGLSAEHELKMRLAVNRWVDGAVLRPDAADKPIWFNDPRAALFVHLKQFTYSFHETILKRVMHEVRNGNHTPAYALLSYVPIMIAADMIKGLLQGGGEQPQWKKGWTVGDYLWSGVQRAGLLGVGQFAVDAAEGAERGGSALGALSGPTVEQLDEVLSTVGGSRGVGATALDALPANALYKSSLTAQ